LDGLTMMSYESALDAVLSRSSLMHVESVPLEQALMRVLARDVHMDIDVPPFDKSAVDGFACRRTDLPGALLLAEEIAAGAMARRGLRPGECMSMMTGAPLPEGADCVVMKEQAEQVGEDRIRVAAAPESDHYCRKGEDICAGGMLMARGTRLGPQHLAALATAGCVQPAVFGRPRVGVIATGSELVAPEQRPTGGQIRDSNSAQLAALLRQLGCDPKYYGIAEDTSEALTAAFAQALEECDVLLSTGGVSVGAYDLVPEIAEMLGLTTHVRKVAIQPGKPMVFATSNECALFGLSGNPVSSYVQFLLFVQPYLLKRMGTDPAARSIRVPLAEDVSRRNTERMQWIPVRFTPAGEAAPVQYHGSAHLFSLMQADGLIALGIGEQSRTPGTPTDVRLL